MGPRVIAAAGFGIPVADGDTREGDDDFVTVGQASGLTLKTLSELSPNRN